MTNAELIAKIKAEVERRIKRNKEEYAPDGLFEVQDNLAKLLSFLSSLESEKSMNLEEELNEEIKRFVAKYNYERSEILLIVIVANHFAEWGAKHLKK